ncbi:hypothetical protein KQI52_04840 [bacterium]|nr:hypothetical protein [bacterium]
MLTSMLRGIVFTGVTLMLAFPAGASADDDQSRRRAPKPVREAAEDVFQAVSPLQIGAYGEHHFNGVEGTAGEFSDVHRFVIGIGYTFADWIQFSSELEVEHAYVNDGDGDVVLEQFLVDFQIARPFNIRAGRVLAPGSWVNMYHEPPTFHGVERPFVDQVIVPSTWSVDGVGVFGQLGRRARYQVYVGNGLDASGFSAASGIRGGRMKERPGFTDPAFMGRVDISLGSGRRALGMTRVGVFGYMGGANNGNKGTEPNLDVDVTLISSDLSTSISLLELKGFVALGMINNADLLAGVAEEFFGYSVEGAVDVLPRVWKSGKLEEAQFYIFSRFERYDTQYKMPDGVMPDEQYNRTAITSGITFLPVPKLAVKADYQVLDNASDNDPANAVNLGIGWMF